MADGKGLRFDAPVKRSMQDLGGIVFTPSPLACQSKSPCEAGALTIEIGFHAETEESSCLKRIVELRQSDGSAAFYLGQWKSWLIVRSFKQSAAEGRPYDEIGIPGSLAAGRTGVLTIVSGPHETAIYTDGQLAKNTPAVRLLKDHETLNGHYLYIGNSPDLSCPWSGSVWAFAIYGKAWAPADVLERRGLGLGTRSPCPSGPGIAVACYRFDSLEGEFIPDRSGSANDLWKPRHLVFEKRLLGLPSGQFYSLADMALNLAGFIPLGFLLCLRLRGPGRHAAETCILFSVALGFAVSLMIEVIQVWLPGRDSSVLDLISNTAGAAIGAFLGMKFE